MSIIQFQGILKPSYNSVDMIEVELLDDDSEPREFSEKLLMVPSFHNYQRDYKLLM